MFEASKLPPTRWFLAVPWLMQCKCDVSALEFKRHTGVCLRAACQVKHEIVEAMRLAKAPRQLTGRVEIDGADLGAECTGRMSGHGSEDKVLFVADVQTTDGGLRNLARLATPSFTTNAYRPQAEVQFRFDWHHELHSLLGAPASATVRPKRGVGVAELHRQTDGVWALRP